MNKEQELLKQALAYLSGLPARSAIQDEIEAYLSSPSDDAEEPVAWMLNAQTFTGDTTWYLSWSKSGAGVCNRLIGDENEKPLYLHPPKPAEPEAETIEALKAENFKLASGQCTEGGPWGDEGGTPYCKYAKRKPMNADV